MKIIKILTSILLTINLGVIFYSKSLDKRWNTTSTKQASLDSVDKNTGQATDKTVAMTTEGIGQVLGTTEVDFVPNNIDPTTEIVEGECWGSIASKSNTAHRCSVGNTIYDPCFKVDEKKVSCYSDPEEAPLLTVTVQDPLPDSIWSDQASWLKFAKDSDALPWFAYLADGSRCEVLTGTPVPIDKVFYYYTCTNWMDNVRYGEINININPWRMKLVDYSGIKPDIFVNITKVYK